MSSSTLTWEEVCAIPWLRDLPAKIETNKDNKILMSPASSWHGGFQGEICHLLKALMEGGRVFAECPIETTDGTRVADAAWMSRERWRPHRKAISLPVAPEVCVEILSPSNAREEMLEKRNLYYAAGALEVWLCHEDGRMEFFRVGRDAPAPRSGLCPEFPAEIETE